MNEPKFPRDWSPGFPLDPQPSAIEDIHAERVRNRTNWGEQNYPSIVPISRGATACRLHGIPTEAEAKQQVEGHARLGTLTWADVLLEEFAEAVAAPDEAHRRAELVQVAAVALAWIECIDRRAVAAAEPRKKVMP